MFAYSAGRIRKSGARVPVAKDVPILWRNSCRQPIERLRGHRDAGESCNGKCRKKLGESKLHGEEGGTGLLR
jgi:hypothetical protein